MYTRHVRLLEMGKEVFENAIVDTSILLLREGNTVPDIHKVFKVQNHRICSLTWTNLRHHPTFLNDNAGLLGTIRAPDGEKPWSNPVTRRTCPETAVLWIRWR